MTWGDANTCLDWQVLEAYDMTSRSQKAGMAGEKEQADREEEEWKGKKVEGMKTKRKERNEEEREGEEYSRNDIERWTWRDKMIGREMNMRMKEEGKN